MSRTLAFYNGELVPAEEVSLSPSDAGLVFGATVTDFCRTFGQRLVRHADHLARFRRDCGLCFVPIQFDDDVLSRSAEQLVRHNAALAPYGTELALITFATPGPLAAYAGTTEDGPPTLVMHTAPLALSRYAAYFRQGVHLSPVAAPSPGDLSPPWAKHRSRLHWWRAARLATPGTLALLVLPDGTVTETAIGNVLLVRGDAIIAAPPPLVLDGISQRVTRQLGQQLGLSWREQAFSLDDCHGADEVLLTGSAFCIACVSRIGENSRPHGGPVYRRLLEAWNGEVGLDIERQFLGG
jgi:branched-chain amino acid aminotransferase